VHGLIALRIYLSVADRAIGIQVITAHCSMELKPDRPMRDERQEQE
jgi:hypothetical protein